MNNIARPLSVEVVVVVDAVRLVEAEETSHQSKKIFLPSHVLQLDDVNFPSLPIPRRAHQNMILVLFFLAPYTLSA